MREDEGSQLQRPCPPTQPAAKPGFEAVVPNPELKLTDQVRQVLRVDAVDSGEVVVYGRDEKPARLPVGRRASVVLR